MSKLTGRRRYRAWLGKVLLQVEEVTATQRQADGSIIERATRWRDATFEDLTVEGEAPRLLRHP